MEDGTELDVEGLPAGVSIGHNGATVEIVVSPGYQPTTVKFVKGEASSDAW